MGIITTTPSTLENWRGRKRERERMGGGDFRRRSTKGGIEKGSRKKAREREADRKGKAKGKYYEKGEREVRENESKNQL